MNSPGIGGRIEIIRLGNKYSKKFCFLLKSAQQHMEFRVEPGYTLSYRQRDWNRAAKKIHTLTYRAVMSAIIASL